MWWNRQIYERMYDEDIDKRMMTEMTTLNTLTVWKQHTTDKST